jgi:hypothetical protein
VQPYPHTLALQRAHEYLAAVALGGKVEPPDSCEVDGTACVRLRVERSGVSATLCFGVPGEWPKAWSEVHMGDNPAEAVRLMRELFDIEEQLGKIFHALVAER